jgi:hypothetical protein
MLTPLGLRVLTGRDNRKGVLVIPKVSGSKTPYTDANSAISHPIIHLLLVLRPLCVTSVIDYNVQSLSVLSVGILFANKDTSSYFWRKGKALRAQQTL